MSTADRTCPMMVRVAKSEAAAAKWRDLAARAPDGSIRERACRDLARVAEEDANVSYLRAINPGRSRWDSIALPVRIVGARS